MEVVSRSPRKRRRRIEVLRCQDGLYRFRVAPSGPSGPGIYTTAEQAMTQGLASPEWVHPYRGMSTNERLAAAGLLHKFDNAIQAGDRAAAVECLVHTGVDPDQACSIVYTLLQRKPDDPSTPKEP